MSFPNLWLCWMALCAVATVVSDSLILGPFPMHQETKSPAVELRRKAIRVAIAMTSGAYKTSLVSYFTHRDLFPSLMKVSILKPRYESSKSNSTAVCQ